MYFFIGFYFFKRSQSQSILNYRFQHGTFIRWVELVQNIQLLQFHQKKHLQASSPGVL